MGTASVGSSFRIATSSRPGTCGAVSVPVGAATADGATLGDAAGGSEAGVAVAEVSAFAVDDCGTDLLPGGAALSDFLTVTFGGLWERRGFGTAGDVTILAPLLRRGISYKGPDVDADAAVAPEGLEADAAAAPEGFDAVAGLELVPGGLGRSNRGG